MSKKAVSYSAMSVKGIKTMEEFYKKVCDEYKETSSDISFEQFSVIVCTLNNFKRPESMRFYQGMAVFPFVEEIVVVPKDPYGVEFVRMKGDT